MDKRKSSSLRPLPFKSLPIKELDDSLNNFGEWAIVGSVACLGLPSVVGLISLFGLIVFFGLKLRNKRSPEFIEFNQIKNKPSDCRTAGEQVKLIDYEQQLQNRPKDSLSAFNLAYLIMTLTFSYLLFRCLSESDLKKLFFP
jgi:hypothetical protein